MTRPSDIPQEIYERADILCGQFRNIEDGRELIARVLMEVGQGAQAAPSALGLTTLQASGLEFIADYQRAHGASPSYTDIGAALDIKSRGSVHALVHQLLDRGVIQMASRRARSIAIVGRG